MPQQHFVLFQMAADVIVLRLWYPSYTWVFWVAQWLGFQFQRLKVPRSIPGTFLTRIFSSGAHSQHLRVSSLLPRAFPPPFEVFGGTQR